MLYSVDVVVAIPPRPVVPSTRFSRRSKMIFFSAEDDWNGDDSGGMEPIRLSRFFKKVRIR